MNLTRKEEELLLIEIRNEYLNAAEIYSNKFGKEAIQKIKELDITNFNPNDLITIQHAIQMSYSVILSILKRIKRGKK